jgi:HD-GYP domain-containing protein (c-di-GMP phosphodiesterase class II)
MQPGKARRNARRPSADPEPGSPPAAGGPAEEYTPIQLASLRVDTVTGFPLYLRAARRGNTMTLYRAGDLKFTDAHRERLRANGVAELYIAAADRKQYLRYLEGNLDEVLKSESIPAPERAKILYSSASLLVEDVLADPTLGASIARAHRFVDTTVDHLFRRAEHFTDLLEVMSFDYHTYTHSVNVCVFGVALARRLGYGQRDLNRLGSGLLLHDAGKAAIDPVILHKRGPLTDREWDIIKSHPQKGVELLAKSGAVEPDALAVVHQHHEKCAGGGYPQGLTAERIHSFAKVAAVADVFDALTTERTYKRAVASFPAIRLMQVEMADSFDRGILRELVLLLHRSQQQAAEQEKDGKAAA